MELEELKIFLEEKSTIHSAKKNLLSPGIRTVSVLVQIEKNLKWELFFASAFLLFSTIGIFLFEEVFIKFFLVLMAAYTALFIRKLFSVFQLSKRAADSSQPVKICLQESIRAMEGFMHLYQRLTVWFMPLVFLAALAAASISSIFLQDGEINFPIFTLLAALPVIAAWIWLMHKLSDWWLERLYGGPLMMMKTALRELEADDL